MTVATENMSIKYFDTLEYVKKSQEIHDPGVLAEYQVKKIEAAIETAVQYIKSDTANHIIQMHEKINNELATKSDLLASQAITKSDIQTFQAATKSDIQTFQAATKSDIQAFQAATKSDIQAFQNATKNEIQGLQNEMHVLQAATKSDIKDLRYDMLKFTIQTGIASVITLGGMIAHGFGWF